MTGTARQASNGDMAKRGDRRYRPRERAALLAAVQAGESPVRAAAEIRIPERTAQRWIAKWRAMSPELIPAQDALIAELAGEIQLDMLDYMKDQDRAEQWRNAYTINAIRGTARDKQQKATAAPVTINVNTLITDREAAIRAAMPQLAPPEDDP